MKVLITHPEFKDLGGVSNYFITLKDRVEIQNRNFSVGRRHEEKNPLLKIFRLFNDYVRFIKVLKTEHYDLVHINPSLDFKSIVRDGVFILLAKHYKKKVIVFFHGWEKGFEKEIENKALWLFRSIYKKSNAFIVLASEFKSKLREWTFNQPIYLETTIIDDDMIKDFYIEKAIKKRTDSNCKILFFSRIIKEKGIYETIDAVRLLKNKFPDIELIIAGDGEELQNVKNYVKSNKVSNVIFAGYVRGEEKRKLFEDSYIYCFPTYAEGMPISVIETMAFGLPVVTRLVGGIADFFENSKHGFATESKNPSVFASYIEKLILDEELYKRISFYNYKFAQERFLASRAAKRLEKIYSQVLTMP